ncbi:MAG: alpha/beta fold hydrolase [Lachnospiraceae bacterium]|nr:alpha/beta fold hydrolase [Lachnospiraceae bacterium]
MKNLSEKGRAVRFFLCSMLVLVFCSVMIWGFQSDWGKITIKRIYIDGPNGTQISSLAYVPKTATKDNPAPLAVIFHGRSNHAHSNDTWSMELARRGYVVLSPDLQGGGESDVSIDRNIQSIYVTEYANNLDYIVKDDINLIGYSAGTATVLATYNAMPEKVGSVCEVFGPFMMKISGGFSKVDADFCLIKSTADQYDGDFLGNPDDCLAYMKETSGISDLEVNKDYKDWKGKYFFRYAQIDGTLHQTGNISDTTIVSILDYEHAVNKEPVSLEPTNTVWGWQQLFSGIACVTMMFVLVSLINLLMQVDFFKSMANAVPFKEPRKGGKQWAIDILFTTLIPALIFVHVSAYVIKWTGAGTALSPTLTSANLNGIMGWLLVVALIGVVRMVIRANKLKKDGKTLKLSDYALGGEDETKIQWSRLGKAFIIGIIVLCFVGCWLWLIEGFAGINYQVWNLSTYLEFSPMRITRAIPYMIIIGIVMFIGNMNQRVLPSTGNEKKDMWIAVAVNSFLTASALFFLLLIQYGGSMILGNGTAPIGQIDIYGTGVNKSSGSLDFAFGYCYMMGGTTGVVTYLYRKYGNIWIGVIPAAMFAGMVTLSGFTLVA